jgi:hypothetical protein
MSKYGAAYHAIARRKSYYKHRERYLSEQNERARRIKRELVTERGSVCADCGGAFPPESFHFDHRDPSTKTANPGQLLPNCSMSRIREETDKCDLVCANCHATRTRNDPRCKAKRGAPSGRIVISDQADLPFD